MPARERKSNREKIKDDPRKDRQESRDTAPNGAPYRLIHSGAQ